VDIPAVLRTFVAEQKTCVIATTRRDGSIRQSVVVCAFDDDRILASTTASRAKARDIERSSWASLCIFGHEQPYPSVTIEGSARIIRDNVGDLTRKLYASLRGTSDGAPTDEQLAAAGRVLIEISPDHWYGASYLEVNAEG
jgi:PPOX class probable F420-dependent enzyme